MLISHDFIKDMVLKLSFRHRLIAEKAWFVLIHPFCSCYLNCCLSRFIRNLKYVICSNLQLNSLFFSSTLANTCVEDERHVRMLHKQELPSRWGIKTYIQYEWFFEHKSYSLQKVFKSPPRVMVHIKKMHIVPVSYLQHLIVLQECIIFRKTKWEITDNIYQFGRCSSTFIIFMYLSISVKTLW